jgi:hypothetical protein
MENKNTKHIVPHTATEKQDNDKAVRMIILVACLNYAMVDIQTELEDAGMFKQQLKRHFNQANKLVMYAHNRFFSMLTSKNFIEAKRQYLKYTDATWDNISNTVMLTDLEGAVNKGYSLCRLALKYNDELRNRYGCWFVDKLNFLLKVLEETSIKNYNLDFIIEKQLAY